MTTEDREERAAERYKIVQPLLDPALDPKLAVQKRKAIAKQFDLDERTLRRWIGEYKEKGFEGLKPAVRKNTGEPAITKDILNAAIELRREVPKRSVQTIIQILEMDGVVPEGSVKRSTLQEALAGAGYSSTQMRSYAPKSDGHYARRFQKEHRNESWQIDIKYGPYLGYQQTYLFTVIDDATRYVVHSEFFMKQNQESLVEVLRTAFTTGGIPTSMYLDNGKVFRSRYTERIAAKLGIRLTFIKPYKPCGHGKIERYNLTVEGFFNEVALEKLKQPEDLERLNYLYQTWLEECYQRAPHSGIDEMTPREKYEKDTQPLRFATEEELAYAFLQTEVRKVNKSGCISLYGDQWEIAQGSLMIGQTVEVQLNPLTPDEVGIECEGFPKTTAKKLQIQPNTGARPQFPEEQPPAASDGSRLLKRTAERFEKRREQERQNILSFSSLMNEKGTN